MARRTWLVIGSGALVGVLAALVVGAAAASGGPPASTNVPTVTGSPGVGKTLGTTTGSWNTTANFTYQWVRCAATAKGAACAGPNTEIPGANAATYTLVAADVGHFIFARVTATNAAGSASALSSGKGVVEAKAPGVEHKPWIRGTKKIGRTLGEADDQWSRFPYMWRDQWLRCSANGKACVRIKGEKKQCANGVCIRTQIGIGGTYSLTAKDQGHRIRVRVTAWNGAGRNTSISNPTPIIKS